MATINLCGNVGKDAVLRKVHNGEREDSVVSIWVAENIKKRDGSKETLWHKVTIWRGYADALVNYLKSGREVSVVGTCRPKFFTRDNQVIPYIDIQASEVKLHGGRQDEDVPPETETEDIESPWVEE